MPNAMPWDIQEKTLDHTLGTEETFSLHDSPVELIDLAIVVPSTTTDPAVTVRDVDGAVLGERVFVNFAQTSFLGLPPRLVIDGFVVTSTGVGQVVLQARYRT